MKNEAERFWKYLLEKEVSFLKKEEVKKNYKDFQVLWKQKNNFEKVFDSLRKTSKIFFLIDKQWCVLREKEFSRIKENKSIKNYVFFEKLFDYFKEKGIKAYFGLGSAEYFMQEAWQISHTFYIINERYNLRKKVGNQTIVLIKFPKEVFIENAILRDVSLKGKVFSNKEKTFLDEIYYNEYLKGKINLEGVIDSHFDFEKIKMYLFFYKKYPLVKIKLVSLLDENLLKKLR